MIRLLIFICAFALIGIGTSACSELASHKENAEEITIKNMLKEAEERIYKATEKAIDSINSTLEKKLQSNVSQADSTINNEIDKIKKTAEEEKSKIKDQLGNVNKKLETADSDIKGHRITITVIILFLLVIIIEIIVRYVPKFGKKRINGVNAQSSSYNEQKQLIKDMVEEECNKVFSSVNQTNKPHSKDIESIVHNYCYNDNFKGYIRKIIVEVLQNYNPNTFAPNREGFNRQTEVSHQTDKATTEKGCILYARDSRTKELEISGKDYQKGKSLYKLILDSPDSVVATLDLCLNEEGATEQIIRRDIQYLGVICAVNRKTYNPSVVKVIEPGIAEKRDNNIWEVTKQIKVELE